MNREDIEVEAVEEARKLARWSMWQKKNSTWKDYVRWIEAEIIYCLTHYSMV